MSRESQRILAELKDLTYSDRLWILKLHSLGHRRRRGDMMEAFTYIRGICISDKPSSCLLQMHSRADQGRLLTLCQDKGDKSLFWNNLPDKLVRVAENVNIFKCPLDNLDGIKSYDPSCCLRPCSFKSPNFDRRRGASTSAAACVQV